MTITAAVKAIKNYTAALLIHGYTIGKKRFHGVIPIITVNQAEGRRRGHQLDRIEAELHQLRQQLTDAGRPPYERPTDPVN